MQSLPKTRHSLLIRLKDRSEDAWAEFIQIYEKSIFEFAKRKGLQEADALDVTQDVLTAVEAKVQSWNADPAQGKFRGWLFRVARNIAVDKIIERTRAPKSVGNPAAASFIENVADRSNESDEFLREYRRHLLHWAAEQVRPSVTDKSWRAFWLTAMEGRVADEVSEQLELTKGNVYAAKFRVTAKIQKLVDRFCDFELMEWPDDRLSDDPPFRNGGAG